MAESIIALSVVVIGLLALLALVSNSISANKDVGNKYAAANLAAEGIELIKNMVDANIMNNRPFNSGHCLEDTGNGFKIIDYEDTIDSCNAYNGEFLKFDNVKGYNYADGEQTIYQRKINVRWLSNQIKVESIVNWIRGGKNFEIKLEDKFFNWR